MRINLNDPTDFTIENLRKLIASEEDSTHTQLRVTKDGYLFLTKYIYADLSDILFCMETFIAGNGYVGQEASEDDGWLNEIIYFIKQNWPESEGLSLG